MLHELRPGATGADPVMLTATLAGCATLESPGTCLPRQRGFAARSGDGFNVRAEGLGREGNFATVTPPQSLPDRQKASFGQW